MSQRQRYQSEFRPEIDYNGHIRHALQTVIELPKVSDFISESIPQAGIQRSSSTFSKERHERAVRNLAWMIVDRMRDDKYRKALKEAEDPKGPTTSIDKLWNEIWELLDRNGFWQHRKRESHL